MENLTGNFISNEGGKITILYERIEGSIFLREAAEIYAPNLKEITGSIYTENATLLDAPELVTVKQGIEIRKATRVNIPKLKNSGYFNADSVVDFSAASLVKIRGYLNIAAAKTFSAPELKEVRGEILGYKCIEFCAPSLVSAQKIELAKTLFVRVPKLKCIAKPKKEDYSDFGSLYVPEAEEIWAGSLETIEGNLNGKRASKVFLPKLAHASEINLPTIEPKLPKLTSCGVITTKQGTCSFDAWKERQDAKKRMVKKTLQAEEGMIL